ncbi:MAG: RICIN domain-containing protein [Atopobiaceae bacterium]|nr:RICIN domain-containing protein [Atopobiaceae bacterium]
MMLREERRIDAADARLVATGIAGGVSLAVFGVGLSPDETARDEMTRGEMTNDQTGRGQTARGTTPHRETARGETVRRETARGLTARGEMTRGQTARREITRGQTARDEMTRGQTARNEAAHNEAARDDESAEFGEMRPRERTLTRTDPISIEPHKGAPTHRPRIFFVIPVAVLLAAVLIFLGVRGFLTGKKAAEGESPAAQSSSASVEDKIVGDGEDTAMTSGEGSAAGEGSIDAAGDAEASGHASASVEEKSGATDVADAEENDKAAASKKETKNDSASSGIPLAELPSVRVDSGVYVLRSMIGNRVLEIDEEHIRDDEANAQIWQPMDYERQFFKIEENSTGYTMQSCASKKLLDAAGDDLLTSANVQQQDDNGNNDQRWGFQDAGDGWVYVHNLLGYYLDVEGSHESNKDGGNVHTWPFNGDDAQKWKLVRVSGVPMQFIKKGGYVIRSASEGKVLSVFKGSHKSGAKICLEEADGSAGQLFRVGKDPVIPANNIRLADFTEEDACWIDASGADEEAAAIQLPGDGGQSQNWFFEKADEDSYNYIRNMFGYYLDASTASDLKSVWCAAFTGSKAQMWTLEFVSKETKE